jgi:hypothetical protein
MSIASFDVVVYLDILLISHIDTVVVDHCGPYQAPHGFFL